MSYQLLVSALLDSLWLGAGMYCLFFVCFVFLFFSFVLFCLFEIGFLCIMVLADLELVLVDQAGIDFTEIRLSLSPKC